MFKERGKIRPLGQYTNALKRNNNSKNNNKLNYVGGSFLVSNSKRLPDVRCSPMRDALRVFCILDSKNVCALVYNNACLIKEW